MNNNNDLLMFSIRILEKTYSNRVRVYILKKFYKNFVNSFMFNDIYDLISEELSSSELSNAFDEIIELLINLMYDTFLKNKNAISIRKVEAFYVHNAITIASLSNAKELLMKLSKIFNAFGIIEYGRFIEHINKKIMNIIDFNKTKTSYNPNNHKFIINKNKNK